MIHRWIAYLGALGAAVLFQIFFRDYFSTFFLLLVLLLPLLSLALSLPGLLRCTVEAVPSALTVVRGEPAQFRAVLRCPALLPLACLRVTLLVENQLTGACLTLRRDLRGVAGGASFPVEAPTSHCGRLLCTVRRARALDLLGLFSLPVRVQGRADLLVLPVPAEAELPPETAGAEQPGRILRPRPGGGPGEDYELRDYRPGDPMRSVHWKLSSKWDELIVRERSETPVPLPLLTLDRFGPPEALDRLLDRLAGLSRALLDIQRPHGVLWLDRDGQPQLRVVSDEKQFNDCLLDLLGSFAPLRGPSLEEHPELLRGPDGPVFRIHVGQEGGNGHD